jgi:hypothetical protein
MTDLPTRIEAGEATDAEVATALGYRSAPDGYGMGDDWFAPDGKRLKRPPGNTFSFPPPFTTCLTTLAKECERRGIKWVMAHQVEGAELWIASVGSSDVDWRSGIAPTPAAALCAALVRAAQKPAR